MHKKTIEMTQEIIDRYGRLNGDRDVLHYDDDYARERGFRGTLAHGLMVQGYANDLAVQKHGRDWFERGVIEVRFVGPTCPGDELSVEIDDDGTLTAKVPSNVSLVGRAYLRDDESA